MDYDSKGDTLDHIQKVQSLIYEVVVALLGRAVKHDKSKLESPEKETLDEWSPRLRATTYGSQEYRDMLSQMPAMGDHVLKNRHHPEYHDDGIAGMSLIDLIEMLCDWKAATLRHDDGDIRRSLEINRTRFDMRRAIYTLLKITIEEMGWEESRKLPTEKRP